MVIITRTHQSTNHPSGGVREDMTEKLKRFIKILSQQEEKNEMLRMILEEEMRERLKELLEEVAYLEREAFCEEQDGKKNGFYERSLETPLGTIVDLSIPRDSERIPSLLS